MAKNETKMKCLKCGVDMNFHAEKVNYEAGPIDPDFGGVVEEAHSCPQCGRTEVRIAD